MANYPGGVRVTGTLTPTSDTDTYGTHKDIFGIGGLHSVADITERNIITQERRKEGMLCYVESTQKTYQLLGGTDNIYWQEFTTGSGDPSGDFVPMSLLNDFLNNNIKILWK